MKKHLLVLAILTAMAFNCLAQTNYNDHSRISFGFIYGATVGPASNNYTYASGFLAKYELPVKSSALSLTLTSGYSFFVPQTRYTDPAHAPGVVYDNFDYAHAAFVPVELGARFYLVKKLYIEGNVGASFNVNSHPQYYTNKTVALLVSPNLGYAFRFGPSGKVGLDLNLGYEDRFESATTAYRQGSYGRIALSAALSFGL
ncbi:hypothetical protein [Mucilaginibacter sp. FT3.2]|uniref:hypothetical protein n=1 Tax=Mucilaginibacter sp. FT3.2 TaxID=2723090 RepID=UPI001615BD4F|nr:hypothetical protein [Mucilaginibacter sp. FT3.2]MBB6235068.1 hypothetical protein [Mucilaginibacter sp. FT3.2]